LPSAVKATEEPVIEAVTEFAMNVASSVHRTLACPFASVALVLALSVPLPGAAFHVTVTPLTGAPAELVTVTSSGAASIDDIVACCASPLVFAITFPCTVFPLDESGPGVIVVAAAHARVAMNSAIAGVILMRRIERRRRRGSLRSPGLLTGHVGRRSARTLGNLILAPRSG
jgi:hypothetical protein